MEARSCSLCREAEKQGVSVKVFLLKDTNPSKPGRWLALPRIHPRSLDLLNDEQRAELWSAAIAKGKRFLTDKWAMAYNAPSVQQQSKVHAQTGNLIPGAKPSNSAFA